MVALVAVGQSVGVRVVEQRAVSIAPGKFLEGDVQTQSANIDIHPISFLYWQSGGVYIGGGSLRLTLERMRR